MVSLTSFALSVFLTILWVFYGKNHIHVRVVCNNFYTYIVSFFCLIPVTRGVNNVGMGGARKVHHLVGCRTFLCVALPLISSIRWPSRPAKDIMSQDMRPLPFFCSNFCLFCFRVFGPPPILWGCTVTDVRVQYLHALLHSFERLSP